MSDEFMMRRRLTDSEKRLTKRLLSKAPDVQVPSRWLDDVMVEALPDGGMGSLRFCSGAGIAGDRKFGREAAELQFWDADGVVVLASLYLDARGEPFELDIWKTDFSPLVRIPDDISDV